MARFFDPEDGTGPDILLTATMAEPSAEIGRFAHKTEDFVDFRTGPNGVFAYSPFCAAFNASGQPAASVPLGMSRDGMPIGVHLATRFGADEELIGLCAELERAAPWMGRRPGILA
jgi:amidase/6-aminohexanoate-cyclic-dimer hydrolase